jgi:hypothetical protein
MSSLAAVQAKRRPSLRLAAVEATDVRMTPTVIALALAALPRSRPPTFV